MPPQPRSAPSRSRSRYLGSADNFSHGDDRQAAILLIAANPQSAAAIASDAGTLLERLGSSLQLRIADLTSHDGEYAVSTQATALREASVARLVVLPVTVDEGEATMIIKRFNGELRRWRLLPELRIARLGATTTTDVEVLAECLERASAGWLAAPAADAGALQARAKRATDLGAAQ